MALEGGQWVVISRNRDRVGIGVTETEKKKKNHTHTNTYIYKLNIRAFIESHTDCCGVQTGSRPRRCMCTRLVLATLKPLNGFKTATTNYTNADLSVISTWGFTYV